MIVPLIRSAAVAPILRWMRENDRDPGPMLQKVDLGWYSEQRPLEPIPLRSASKLLRNLARVEGPDLPWRIVRDGGFYEIGLLASISLKAHTPRGIMKLVESAIPVHCTNETFTVSENSDNDLIAEHGWTLVYDDETLHYVQQYCAAMVTLVCGLTPHEESYFRDIQMVPHPENGLDHLRPWLGDCVAGHDKKSLKITIPAAIADAPISLNAAESPPLVGNWEWVPLREGMSVSYSVVLLLKGMLRDGNPTIDRIAAASATSRRSLQRSLAAEGTTFSAVLETARHQLAKEMIKGGETSMRVLATELGYANQSAFTRAFRRWEGHPPMYSVPTSGGSDLE